MKLTRHNGRSGKNGTYNPRHNDRRFNVENSEHIDVERSGKNIYWDCYRGFTLAENRNKDGVTDFTFEQIERVIMWSITVTMWLRRMTETKRAGTRNATVLWKIF